ncbi:DUF1240 domain-containing protein [Vibrio coralliilyticus]|uniref:DUF2079 domain-containing protein n=1 Tax=Vibrio coralliilyticus TaxID=190893 RepID=A0AAN0SI39_9VIBR|nr:DUF1240 domain-containing protein [Vibrio coralliilyticus]AIW22932.1 hypothetical protein IX92_28290 [Vibrio coralliilyticus]NOH38303.1 DUF1240 domain-containing protein [Vibrio coralliilyticus]NOH54984.1 DUF1240 domain-containing protein [Vibrio coralliilyticus]
MSISHLIKKIKRVSKFFPATLIGAGLTSACFYLGLSKIANFAQEIGNVAVYSRFDFSLIPFGIVMLGFTITAVYYIYYEKRFEDTHGHILNYTMVVAFALSIILVFITPSIYQNRLENAGLKECSNTPSSYLPLFGTKYVKDESLCRLRHN